MNQSINQNKYISLLIERYGNSYYSDNMNLYLHICNKTSHQFTEMLSRSIYLLHLISQPYLIHYYNNLAIHEVSFVEKKKKKKKYPGDYENIKGQSQTTELGYWDCVAMCYDHYYSIALL